MLLTSLLLIPLVVALLCLVARQRILLEALNVSGFAIGLVLGVKLFRTVLAREGAAVMEWGEFLRALMVNRFRARVDRHMHAMNRIAWLAIGGFGVVTFFIGLKHGR